MGTRLKFLGLAVFFAMVAVLGAAALLDGNSSIIRWWFLLIAGGVCCVLSLVGVFAPKKMKWLMDAWKKRNSTS